jgi:PTS system mannose-specific IIA component
MIGILILSHGQFADELLAAARTISGELPPQFDSLSLDWSDGFNEAQAKISEALERLDSGHGVLILTDMFGGTPCNVAITFMEPGKVEIVTGVNLPMVVRLGCLLKQEMGLSEVAYWLQEKGRRSVCVASDLKPPPRTLEKPSEPASGDDGGGGRRRSELGAALAAARESGR